MDVVVGDRVAYHDVVRTLRRTRTDTGYAPLFEGAPAVLGLEVLDSISRPHRGLIASGDQFVDNAADLAKITALYPDVKAVDMESAAMAPHAIARVCPSPAYAW